MRARLDTQANRESTRLRPACRRDTKDFPARIFTPSFGPYLHGQINSQIALIPLHIEMRGDV